MIIVCSRSTLDSKSAMEKMLHVCMTRQFHTFFPFFVVVALPELRHNEEIQM